MFLRNKHQASIVIVCVYTLVAAIYSNLLNTMGTVKHMKMKVMRVQTHPVYAKQRAGFTEDADYLFDLTMRHRFADATKHNQSPWLERRIVLKGKPGQNTKDVILSPYIQVKPMQKEKNEAVHTSAPTLSTGQAICSLGYPSYRPGEEVNK